MTLNLKPTDTRQDDDDTNTRIELSISPMSVTLLMRKAENILCNCNKIMQP